MTTQQKLQKFKANCEKWAKAQTANDPLAVEPQANHFTEPYVRRLAEGMKAEALQRWQRITQAQQNIK